MTEEQTILLVDDSENDVLLMRMAMIRAEFKNPMQVAMNGEVAMAYLAGEGQYQDRKQYPLPILMLLDLNMPRKSGFEVLAWARLHPAWKALPIMILTASTRLGDVERAYELGANSFLVKPATMDELSAMLRCMREWLKYNHFPPHNVSVKR